MHPREFASLFNTILINVTAFFRDTESWRHLAAEVLPDLLSARPKEAPIRVWSAGCASGEEPCTLAILLAEELGLEAYRRRVKIYATDVDEEALEQGRRALYTERELQAVPEGLVARYFEAAQGAFALRPELRRSIIYGRHDLVQDAPISRLDVLACRNTLMYLNAETQGRVLARLHYGLRQGGVLILGKAEMLLTQTALFSAVDLKHRLFAKLPCAGERERLLRLSQSGHSAAGEQLSEHINVLHTAFQGSTAPQLVVDPRGRLVLANKAAQDQFNVRDTDLGQPLQDLEVSYRPAELRSLIERAQREGRPVVVEDVERAGPEGENQRFGIVVTPLRVAPDRVIGTSITFQDQTAERRLHEELHRTTFELEHYNEELQSTNEELETTNEELQSSNEELETTNEELQSSNEELETMNEELQSTNEELRMMNEELQSRTAELDDTNTYLESVLLGMDSAVIVVDHESKVQGWKGRAEDLWGLRPEEVHGLPLVDLDIGLPVRFLEEPLRRCLAGEDPDSLVLEAVDRRGRILRCTVICTPLRRKGGVNAGAVLLITASRA